jgi:hypothetical protein
MRPEPLLKLQNLVQKQTVYPNEILIIDGLKTMQPKRFKLNLFDNLKYFKVLENERGLTKQQLRCRVVTR